MVRLHDLLLFTGSSHAAACGDLLETITWLQLTQSSWCGPIAGAAFLMWEVSTPFVYMRWFLFTLGKSQTKAYIINGLLMVFTFFVFRNIMGVGTPILLRSHTGKRVESGTFV